MKTFQILVFLLFFSLTGFGQEEPCFLIGPGSEDVGVEPVECGVIGNYSFQKADGGLCTPPENTPNTWEWCIDNLGPTGDFSINQNTIFPEPFTLTNGIEGLVIAASYVSITIQWNCNDCIGGVAPHINILFGCGDEFYQSSVFVECTPDDPPSSDCTTDTWDCISTDCDCIKVCINGQVEILENDDDGEMFFCYPEGTIFGTITSCENNLLCKGTPPDDFPHDGSEFTTSGSGTDQSNKRYIEIPDVKIVQTNKGKGEMSLTIALPSSDSSFDFTLYDNSGKVSYSETLVNQNEAVIQVSNLQTGIYHVLLTDGNYRITQKIFVN